VSPTSPNDLLERGQFLYGSVGMLADGRREVIALADAAQLSAKALDGSASHTLGLTTRQRSLIDQRLIFGRNLLPHARHKLALLSIDCGFRDPDRGFSARVYDVLGDPLELFTVAGIQRQRNQPVLQVGDT
jgi:hypothetical protein